MHGSRLAFVALAALAATACGSDDNSTTATSAELTTSVATTVVVVPTTLAPPTTVAPTTLAPAPTSAPTTTVAVPPPLLPCTAPAMKLTEGQADGAMGTIYTPLLLTNTGAVACTVSTHVVLTFLDSSDQSVGEAVTTPEAAGPALITLGPAESRQLVLSYGQPGNMDCQPLDTPTTVQLIFNQTETSTLLPEVWPLCVDRLADQVSLGDLELPSP